MISLCEGFLSAKSSFLKISEIESLGMISKYNSGKSTFFDDDSADDDDGF